MELSNFEGLGGAKGKIEGCLWKFGSDVRCGWLIKVWEWKRDIPFQVCLDLCSYLYILYNIYFGIL